MKSDYEIIRGARTLIAEHGLVKHDLGELGRGFCINGALNMSAHGHVHYSSHELVTLDTFGALQLLDDDIIGDDYVPASDWGIAAQLAHWNNLTEITAADVLSLMDKALVKEEDYADV